MNKPSYCSHGWVGYGPCPQCDPYNEIERLTAEVRGLTLDFEARLEMIRNHLDNPLTEPNIGVLQGLASPLRASASGSPTPLPGRKDVKGILSDDPSRRPASADSSQPHAWVNQGVCCREHATPADLASIMIVCPECGDKRCPRATDCSNTCADSKQE